MSVATSIAAPPLNDDVIASLSSVGFTETEALVYTVLLRSPGITSYRISKLTGKSQANVALAVRGLVKKRAVSASSEIPVTYDPVAVSALMQQLSHAFSERIETAADALSRVEVGVAEDRIRRLVSREEVFAQTQAMLHAARETVLVETTDWTFSEIKPALSGISPNASTVVMTLSEQNPIKGIQILRALRGQDISDYMAPEVLIVIVDSREMLVSLYEPGGVALRQAIWTNNQLLVMLFHNGIVSDVILNTSPELSKIGSPNEFLFGRIPTAIVDTFRS